MRASFGDTPKNKCPAARFTDDRVTVVVLMNLGAADPAIVAHGIAGLYRPALARPDSAKH